VRIFHLFDLFLLVEYFHSYVIHLVLDKRQVSNLEPSAQLKATFALNMSAVNIYPIESPIFFVRLFATHGYPVLEIELFAKFVACMLVGHKSVNENVLVLKSNIFDTAEPDRRRCI